MGPRHMLGHDPFGPRRFVGTEDIIGVAPGWRSLSDSDASRLPYSAICRILVFRNGSLLAAGTGWLVGAATVITAAHVVNAKNADVVVEFRSPSSDRHLAIDVQMHRFFASRDAFRPGSPHDVAALRIPVQLARTPLRIAQPGGLKVEVAGFPDLAGAFFVTDVGDLLRIERGYLSYQADTEGGHSGAPVMVQGRAVGLHLGGFSINPFSGAAANTGLALSGEVLSFVNTAVEEWRRPL